jgi:hypothetical protein
MSRLDLYVALARKCENKALHGGNPHISALWRSLADQYRFLVTIEREHPTPQHDLADVSGPAVAGSMPAAAAERH